jgi:hypothetical protein
MIFKEKGRPIEDSIEGLIDKFHGSDPSHNQKRF